MIKHAEKQAKNKELHSYCYWTLNLTMKIHDSILSLGTWKLCSILVSHWFVTPHPQTTVPPSHHQWEADDFVYQHFTFCWLAASLHHYICETTLGTNKWALFTYQKETKREGEWNWGQKVKRGKMYSLFFGAACGGFCLHEQLQISGDPAFCISAPNLDNLVLSTCTWLFHIFSPWISGSKCLR